MGRQRLLLSLAALVAVVGPVWAARHLDRRVRDDLAGALTSSLGLPVTIEAAEADLTGTLRLEGVAVGKLVDIAALEAAVGLGVLWGEPLVLDEIHVEAPTLRLSLEAGGDPELALLLARLRRRGSSDTSLSRPRRRRVGRIVIDRGDLAVDLGDRGRGRAREFEILSTPSGLRLISGMLELDLFDRRGRVEARFARAAADVDSSDLQIERFLADGGQLSVAGAGRSAIALSRASLSYGVAGDGELGFDAVTETAAQSGSLSLLAQQRLGGWRLSVAADSAPMALIEPLWPGLSVGSRARASGEIEVSRGSQITIDGELDVVDAEVVHRFLADQPVALSGSMTGSARVTWLATQRAIAIDGVQIEVGALRARGRGAVEWSARESRPEQVTVDLSLSPVACDAALSSLPEAFRTQLAGLGLSGEIGGQLSVALSASRIEDARVDTTIDLDDCGVFAEPAIADPDRLVGPFVYQTLAGQFRTLDATDDSYVRLADLPDHVPEAFLAAEDARFYRHSGFDRIQIARSLAINLNDRGALRGGSTITQQLAKNLFLDGRRTMARKFQEAILAWRLEQRLTKKQILELYLNVIQLDDRHIHGLADASAHWFGVGAAELSLRQAVFLAALTSEPTRMSRRIRASAGLDPISDQRLQTVLRSMRRSGFVSQRAAKRAQRGDLKLRRQAIALPWLSRTATPAGARPAYTPR